ncbi:hypothetical protein [Pseudonocardia sediminis]|uniref:hypothetical protein n=1 Tax=Pseudonocardia sediminis TaxID=1397368 RepID=UPI001029219C|nr:hypothetical protein [Pseudonocardia sediminis]
MAVGRGATIAREHGVRVGWQVADVARYASADVVDLVVVQYLHVEGLLDVVGRAAATPGLYVRRSERVPQAGSPPAQDALFVAVRPAPGGVADRPGQSCCCAARTARTAVSSLALPRA